MILRLEAFALWVNKNCSDEWLFNFWRLRLGGEEAVRGSTAPIVGEEEAKEGKPLPRRVAPMRHCSLV